MKAFYSFDEEKTPLLRCFHAEALLASGAIYEVYQSHSQRLKQMLQRESRVETLVSKQEDLLKQTIISFLHSH